MTTTAAITLGITISSFCITVITMLTKQARQEGERSQRLDNVEDETRKNREKIRELYASTNKHDSSIQVLTNTIEQVKETTERIENKLDRLTETRGTI